MTSRGPTGFEGVFYVIRLQAGWKIAAHLDTGNDPKDHVEFWESIVSRQVAESYGIGAAALENLPYAFPRGRVVRKEKGWAVYWGGDFTDFVAKREIECAFKLRGPVAWVRDDHEQCLEPDVTALKELIAIAERWPAV